MTRISARRRAAAVTATALAGALAFGIAAPAHAAGTDPIAPHPDAWGRYYVDAWATNTTANTSPETNAAIGLLTPMLDYWTPEVPPTAAFDASGRFIPDSVGTVKNATVLDANIAEAARITAARTPEQAAAAYRYDRRNQNYSAVQGLGPWADAFRTGTNAGTTIPDEIPADATTVKYDDKGNANGAWADETSTYGPMVALVNQFRNSSASTNPSKAYYNYARPFRWSTDVQVLPTLIPAKQPDANALSDGGYPSGHTNAAYLATLALAYAAPERFQELLTSASDIGNSRIVAGMHSPGDVIGGRIMATAVAAAALNQPANADKMAAARTAAEALLATPGVGADAYADHAGNEKLYADRLTYGLPRVGDTTRPVVVPKGAEVLLASRLPYLTADQRRWVLQSTGLGSGYALLDDAEGWGRLNLYAAADGYSAFDTDVSVDMDAAQGGFSAADSWRNDIEGAGSLTKSGTGALTLTGDNTFTGGTTVNGGTLAAASADALGTGLVSVEGGTLTESATAPVQIGGDLTLAPTSTLELTVEGPAPALVVAGTASVDGTAKISFANGTVPSDDTVIATFGRVGAGTSFDAVQVDGLPAGYTPALRITDGALHLVNTTPAVGSLTAGTPAVGGTPVVGQTLTATPGAWTPTPVTFGYQWFRGSAAIAGATSADYTVGFADVGQTLSVEVTGSKSGYVPQTRTATASGIATAVVTLDDASVTAGDRVTVSGAGFAPGETVGIELRSTPVQVGTAVVGPTGAFIVSITIPVNIPAGAHTIVVTGATSAVTASAPLTVAAAPGIAALAATGGTAPLLLVPFLAGGLLLTGAAMVIVRRRMRRA
ncbi:phosphatase PAP2 family protein [Microbacterium sp. cx-55]|uniref:phosphatase PAP2 family protein n=1 Tax=Microbacterium sp. cx-55 TaxID=2875948 RepID=UPI001CBC5A62|nr:phosphatase PAP2 family protein [Microbacterium sp. cx-55]MBZ4487314.1 phosphatase PAP2 family protein [Microbacterium sp. cx-55]UGB35336.1 phosphatase PAP2 family protein [Microbacterium sp. cx-55]